MSDTDPNVLYELQKWATDTLKNNSLVRAAIGNPPRLYEDVQENPTFPYASLGPVEENPQQADGVDGSEIYLTYNVWSRQGAVQARTIMAALNAALNLPDGPSVRLDNHQMHVIHRYKQHTLKADDGITVQGVIVFRAVTDPR